MLSMDGNGVTKDVPPCKKWRENMEVYSLTLNSDTLLRLIIQDVNLKHSLKVD